MLVTLSSVRGAPGVSCWALMLASAWPHHTDRVLVEADCSGGVVSVRYDIPVEPGVGDLVALARTGEFSHFGMDTVARLLREATDSESAVWVSPAPLLAHESNAIWATLAKPAASSMVTDPRLWLADCGRVWPGAATEALLMGANLNIVVSDAAVESLVVLQSRVRSMPAPVVVLVVGSTRHSEDELQEFTGAFKVWKVPYLRSLSSEVAGFTLATRRGRHSKAWRTTLAIANALSEFTSSQAEPDRPAVGDSGSSRNGSTVIPISDLPETAV